MKLKIIGYAALLLAGCSGDANNEQKAQATESVAQEQQIKDVPNSEAVGTTEVITKVQELAVMTAEKKALIEKRLSGKLSKSHSFTINGEKYASEATELVKGSKVFNVLMGEWGKVKGSIVVVTSKMQQDHFTQQFSLESVEKIAQDTYRVVPVEQRHLYNLYKALIAFSDIDNVELEIDFSGEAPNREAY